MTIPENIQEKNKKVVIAFYQKALFEGDVDTAVNLCVEDIYVQHTPFAAHAQTRRAMLTLNVNNAIKPRG